MTSRERIGETDTLPLVEMEREAAADLPIKPYLRDRTYQHLEDAGLNTIGEVAAKIDALLSICRFETESRDEIKQVLAHFGFLAEP
jgi:hypothetical protein